ncbi:MAG: type II secretion system F family protein [Candidatus Peregrinibacteria bacterium]
MFSSFFPIGLPDVIVLMRNLSMTLRAGIPMLQALTLFEADARGSRKAVITHLRKSVEAGQPFSAAMASSAHPFPQIAIHLVQVGELSGTLQENLAALIGHLQRVLDLRRKIRSAMLYPMFVLVACLGLGLSVGTIVLPELLPVFSSLDVVLPLSTRILIVVAGFFKVYGMLTAFLAAFVVVLLFIASRLEFFKPWFHRFTLWIPYVRTVQKQTAVAQFTGTLGILLKSGVAVREAIPAAAEAVENRLFRRAIKRSMVIVEGGRTLSEGLRTSGSLFPDMTLSLIGIGEETGTLDDTLEYLATYYQGEVDYAIKDLTTALEPVLLITIGIFVGFTVMAIISPLYDVTGSLG